MCFSSAVLLDLVSISTIKMNLKALRL